jgi:hypothetical protein
MTSFGLYLKKKKIKTIFLFVGDVYAGFTIPNAIFTLFSKPNSLTFIYTISSLFFAFLLLTATILLTTPEAEMIYTNKKTKPVI